MLYKSSNDVINKVASRLKSPKLQAYTEHMMDMSIARMTDRIANSVMNFNSLNSAMNAFGTEIYPLDASCRNYDASSKDFAEGDAGAGMSTSGFSAVRGVDVVDMTLIASVQSMLPTLAVDFGMSKPTDVMAYQGLVSVNAHGEVEEGEDIVMPYKPLNYKAVTSQKGITLDGSTSAEGAVDLGAPVARGTVRVTLDSGVVGEDVKGDGQIYFLGVSDISAEVDYATGTVTITGTPSAAVTITANPDMSSEIDGANTLRLRPKMKKITVDAIQNAVSLENNIESIAYMNKQISGKNYGEIATRQWLDAFIYTLNTGVVNETIKTALAEFPTVTAADMLDLSGYYNGSFTNFAVTKDDRIFEYLSKIEGEMSARSNKGFTYILCGNNAVRVFRTMAKFKSVPQRATMMDGVVGYLDLGMDAQIAIVRHQAMNELDAKTGPIDGSVTGKFANLILGFRDPEGVAAPVGYFEYLPICSTKLALNWHNATQFSQSVFNFSNSKTLIKEYIYRGLFRISAN